MSVVSEPSKSLLATKIDLLQGGFMAKRVICPLPACSLEWALVTFILATAIMVGFVADATPVIKALTPDHWSVAHCRIAWMLFISSAGIGQGVSLLVGWRTVQRWSAFYAFITNIFILVFMLASSETPVITAVFALNAWWEFFIFTMLKQEASSHGMVSRTGSPSL